jgi:hypothetical protein
MMLHPHLFEAPENMMLHPHLLRIGEMKVFVTVWDSGASCEEPADKTAIDNMSRNACELEWVSLRNHMRQELK